MENSSSFKANLSQELYSIRGIAIVLVVIGHVIGHEKNTGIRQMYGSDIVSLTWLCEFIYTFHMPIFFIISGVSFTIFSNKKDTPYLKFAKSKLLRLVIPLLCWAPITLVFQDLSKGIHFSAVDIMNSVIKPYFIFWFFHALLFISILHFILFRIFRNNFVYFVASIILLIGSFYFKSMQIYWYFNIFYAFGLFIAPYLQKVHSRLEKLKSIILLAIVFLGGVVMLTINYYLGDSYNLAAKLLNGTIAFLLMYTLTTSISSKGESWSKSINILVEKVKSIFRYVGKISMTIYVLHILFGSGTRVLLTKLFNITDPYIHLFIGCAMGILGPLVIYNIFYNKSQIFRYSIGESK